ncbi:unnamed protein product [Amaranthus hypochondriacus]
MAEKLAHAVVVEYEKVIDPKHAVSLVNGTNVPYVCMSSISPTKLILFFESELEVLNVIEEGSPLWKIFENVRRWSEDECYNDRLVWLECSGLHPKCWSFENIKMIGEKWGSVLHVDHEDNGVNNLTFARLLVRTKTQSRIDTNIRIEWESGACEVWVKETRICECKNLGELQLSGMEQYETEGMELWGDVQTN